MTINEEEMKQHGKIMEHMKTNREEIEDGKIPDPKQDKRPPRSINKTLGIK